MLLNTYEEIQGEVPSKMSLEEKFMKAAEDMKRLKEKPNEDEMLKMYGLYKQAQFGDCNTDRPGALDFRRLVMWKAWNAEKGLSKDAAKEEYINRAENWVKKYGVN